MAIRAKKLNRRQALDSDAQAWLNGAPSGFFKFQSADTLEELWNAHGETDSMYWRRGMSLPITLEELEANEDSWLNSGESDEYGFNSYFIARYYSDDEKLKLWRERGDHERFRWEPGMSRPEQIETEDAEC